jgi:hypothetical protein
MMAIGLAYLQLEASEVELPNHEQGHQQSWRDAHLVIEHWLIDRRYEGHRRPSKNLAGRASEGKA